VVALLTVGLSLDVLSDGELGIDNAPGLASAAASISSVSVSDHASPADLTDFIFLPRGRPRENALLSELFSCSRSIHLFIHSFSRSLAAVLNTRTTTRSCLTQKRAFHFCSPGVVRRSHAATRHVRALSHASRRCCSVAADTALGNLLI